MQNTCWKIVTRISAFTEKGRCVCGQCTNATPANILQTASVQPASNHHHSNQTGTTPTQQPCAIIDVRHTTMQTTVQIPACPCNPNGNTQLKWEALFPCRPLVYAPLVHECGMRLLGQLCGGDSELKYCVDGTGRRFDLLEAPFCDPLVTFSKSSCKPTAQVSTLASPANSCTEDNVRHTPEFHDSEAEPCSWASCKAGWTLRVAYWYLHKIVKPVNRKRPSVMEFLQLGRAIHVH